MAIEAQNEDKNHQAALYRGAQIAMRGENPQAKNGRRADFVGACAWIRDNGRQAGRQELTSLSLGADILTVLTRNRGS
jgi:hypothetical protein